MSDELDIQSERDALVLEVAITAAMGKPALPYKGCCYYCEELTPQGQNFCTGVGVTCRDDYDNELRLLKIRGH